PAARWVAAWRAAWRAPSACTWRSESRPWRVAARASGGKSSAPIKTAGGGPVALGGPPPPAPSRSRAVLGKSATRARGWGKARFLLLALSSAVSHLLRLV